MACIRSKSRNSAHFFYHGHSMDKTTWEQNIIFVKPLRWGMQFSPHRLDFFVCSLFATECSKVKKMWFMPFVTFFSTLEQRAY